MPYGTVPTQRHRLEGRVVQRAWADPEFRRRLLANPKQALEEELDIVLPEELEVTVVEERTDRLCIVLPVDVSGFPEQTTRVMLGLRPRLQPARPADQPT
jgi:hypothetical protein